MDKDGVFSRVRRIISDHLNLKEEDVKLDLKLVDDLAADSLDEVEILFYIEEEFSLEIHDEDAEKAETVGDIVKYVRENT